MTSPHYPHVEITVYRLFLLLTSPEESVSLIDIGKRPGIPHQHVLDNFGNWVRLDLADSQTELAQLKTKRIFRYEEARTEDIGRLEILLTMCLEQNEL